MHEEEYEEEHEEEEEKTPLIKWAEGRHKWLQHALNLIAKHGSAESIPKDGKDQIEDILVKEAKGEEPSFTPISKFNVPDATSGDPKTYLKRLGPVLNIDKLASNQEPFEFVSPNGMTVIFGNNGSGKSGYARILKNLCRSHGNVRRLKGDVTSIDEKNWEVELIYAEKNENEDEVPKPIKWTKFEEDKAKSDAEYKPLERIAFFDSQVANTYVDEDRELFYFPPELRWYAELANLADKLKEQLEIKIEELGGRLPKLPKVTEGTLPYNIISKLENRKIAELTEEQLNSICCLSEKEKKELKGLKNKKAQTPEQQKIILERAKGALSSLKNDIKRSVDALSSAFLAQLLSNYQKYQAVKTKAEQGVAELAKDMPINEGIGSDIWFEMFRAARDFAGQVYPSATPPPIANGDYCVLCQQGLEEEAKNRLKEFDAFVGGAFHKAVGNSKKAYEESQRTISSLPNLDPDAIAERLQKYADLEESKAEQITSITSDIAAITSRLHKVKKIIEENSFDNLQVLINEEFQMKADVSSFITAIEDEEQRLEKLIAEGMGGLSTDEQNKLSELEDKEKCSAEKDNIKKYFDLSKNINLFNSCKQQLNTTSISRQARSRNDELLSSALEANYSKEIGKLNLTYLKSSVGSQGRKGNPQVRVDIEGVQKIKNSEILSEGEQRAIALAGFLTEVNETDRCHAIIFDDPVSSLDWDRLGLVAERLAEEAKKRQVIVFTHNFSFALQLEKYCKDKHAGAVKESFFKQLWIGKKSTDTELEFGITGEDAVVWEAKKVMDRIKEINKKIDELEASGWIPDGSGTSKFEMAATGIVEDLRQTWERAVEEILLNKTIQRYIPNVMTQRLEEVQFDCTQDYQILHEGMAAISRPTHDSPQHAGGSYPTLEQLKENRKLLSEWVDGLRSKRRALRKISDNASST